MAVDVPPPRRVHRAPMGTAPAAVPRRVVRNGIKRRKGSKSLPVSEGGYRRG